MIRKTLAHLKAVIKPGLIDHLSAPPWRKTHTAAANVWVNTGLCAILAQRQRTFLSEKGRLLGKMAHEALEECDRSYEA